MTARAVPDATRRCFLLLEGHWHGAPSLRCRGAARSCRVTSVHIVLDLRQWLTECAPDLRRLACCSRYCPQTRPGQLAAVYEFWYATQARQFTYCPGIDSMPRFSFEPMSMQITVYIRRNHIADFFLLTMALCLMCISRHR